MDEQRVYSKGRNKHGKASTSTHQPSKYTNTQQPTTCKYKIHKYKHWEEYHQTANIKCRFKCKMNKNLTTQKPAPSGNWDSQPGAKTTNFKVWNKKVRGSTRTRNEDERAGPSTNGRGYGCGCGGATSPLGLLLLTRT